MSSSPRSHLLFAFRKILRPLVAVLIRAGVRYDEFSGLVRGIYAESAIRYGVGDTRRLTRARAALATGLPRRDIDLVIDFDGALPSAEPTLAVLMTELLQRWHTDPAYVGPYGIPLELDVTSETGMRSFADLVRSIDTEIDPKLVLAEMMHMKLVVNTGDRFVRATSRYFMMAEPMTAAQLEYFGNTMTRLAATLQFNMDPGNGVKRLERFVVADRGLPRSALADFEAYTRDKANALLLDIDNWLTPFSSSESASGGDRVSTGLNIFLYVDPPEDAIPLRDLILDDNPKN